MCLRDVRNRIGVLFPGLLQALHTLPRYLLSQRASPAMCQLVRSKRCFLSMLHLSYRTQLGGQ